MSIKFERLCPLLAWLLALGAMTWVSGCDPCRDLAEKICDCEDPKKARECKDRLNLAKSHKFFEVAKDPKRCEEIHKQCPSCEELLRGQDQQCGSYRNLLVD